MDSAANRESVAVLQVFGPSIFIHSSWLEKTTPEPPPTTPALQARKEMGRPGNAAATSSAKAGTDFSDAGFVCPLFRGFPSRFSGGSVVACTPCACPGRPTWRFAIVSLGVCCCPLGLDGTLEMHAKGPPHDDFPIKVDQPEGVAVLLSVLKEVPRMAQKRGLLAQPLPAEVEATDIGPPGSTTVVLVFTQVWGYAKVWVLGRFWLRLGPRFGGAADPGFTPRSRGSGANPEIPPLGPFFI